MKRVVQLLCASLALAAAPFGASAQGSYPSQPVKWIVPYPAGGGTDNLARAGRRDAAFARSAAGDRQPARRRDQHRCRRDDAGQARRLHHHAGRERGKVRALAIALPQRASALPEVPTFAELGLKDVNAYAFHGPIGPVGMPPEAVAPINSELNKAMKSPKVVKLFADLGFEALPGTPQDFYKMAQRERALGQDHPGGGGQARFLDWVALAPNESSFV